MKKRLRIFLTVFASVLGVLFISLSSFIGLQVFAGSTQLITNDQTMGVADGFWKRYGIDKENFHNTYKVEEIAIPSSYENHTIPADYIYAAHSNNKKNHPTVILVHGMGGNRYSNYPIAEFSWKKDIT